MRVTCQQVSVAVLLDNFVSETAREKKEEWTLEQDAHRARDNVSNVLDPLLSILANEYVDDAHLCAFLSQLFCVISQGKQRLDPKDLCMALTTLDVTPRIHFTSLDYDILLQNSKLLVAGDEGLGVEGLGVEEFVEAMRHQVRGFIERKLQRSVSEASEAKEQSEFSTLASIKVLMSDVDSVKSDLRQLHEVKKMGERKCIFLGWGSARVGMRSHARDRMVLDHLYSHGCTNILSIFAPTHTSSLRSLFFLLLL